MSEENTKIVTYCFDDEKKRTVSVEGSSHVEIMRNFYNKLYFGRLLCLNKFVIEDKTYTINYDDDVCDNIENVMYEFVLSKRRMLDLTVQLEQSTMNFKTKEELLMKYLKDNDDELKI